MTPLEIAANAVNALAIVLAGRNSVHTWWTGIVGSVLFGILFFSTQLYADATLQVFFLITSAVGWHAWVRGGAGAKPLAIARASRRLLIGALLAAVAVTAGYGWVLHHFTNAFAPYFDSAVLAFSVVAQLLLMARRLETWWFWLLVNTLSIPLFASRGLTLTAVLYVGFWINAVISLRSWKREYRQ